MPEPKQKERTPEVQFPTTVPIREIHPMGPMAEQSAEWLVQFCKNQDPEVRLQAVNELGRRAREGTLDINYGQALELMRVVKEAYEQDVRCLPGALDAMVAARHAINDSWRDLLGNMQFNMENSGNFEFGSMDPATIQGVLKRLQEELRE